MITVKKRSAHKRVLKRAYHTALRPLKRWYRYFLRPEVRGTKVVVECGGAYLLVRPSYGHGQCTYPGGSVDRGESFVVGAARELYEEAGIRVDPSSLALIGEYRTEYQYRKVHMQVFYVSVSSRAVEIDGDEIIEAVWAKPGAWPPNVVRSVDLVYTHYVKKHIELW